MLQNALLSMVNSLGDGYQFMGIATPSTNPGTPDQRLFYLAGTQGTYANFGGLEIDNEVGIFTWAGGNWVKRTSNIALESNLKKVKIYKNFNFLDGSPSLDDYYSVPKFWASIINVECEFDINKAENADKYYYDIAYFNTDPSTGSYYREVHIRRWNPDNLSDSKIAIVKNAFEENPQGIKTIELNNLFDELLSLKIYIDFDQCPKALLIPSNNADDPFYNYSYLVNVTAAAKNAATIATQLGETYDSKKYEYLVNSGKDYPIVYANSISASNAKRISINNFLLNASIIRSNQNPNIIVQLCFINRSESSLEGIYYNAIQLWIQDGDNIQRKTYKNSLLDVSETGVKMLSFYDDIYKFTLILTIDLDKLPKGSLIWNESSDELYQKTPFDELCYEPLDNNVNQYISDKEDSEYFNYKGNIGKDYPMQFDADAPARIYANRAGYYHNLVLQNIRVFTSSIKKTDEWSFELAYIYRTSTNTETWDNTIGFVKRSRSTGEINKLYYVYHIEELMNGSSNFEYIWEIDGDIVIYTLDFSNFPVGGLINISKDDNGLYAKKMWLDKKQYFYMGTSIAEPASTLSVALKGDILYIAAKLDRMTDIIYQFQKCMFNELFTFYKVGFAKNEDVTPLALTSAPITYINISSSDNIGPLNIADGGWCGGNHSWKNENIVRTAKTDEFLISSNGKILQDGDNIFTNNIEIKVINTIYNPNITPSNGSTILSSPLCTETVIYRISGNSIHAMLNHRFLNEEAVTVNLYYGMQSCFLNEDKLLTPNGKYPNWADIVENGMTFIKEDYPKFNRFIEYNSNNSTYQSTYLMPYELGNHDKITDSAFIFRKSDGKNYHHLISNSQFTSGMSYNWSGLYSWFMHPILDNDNFFVYEGKLNGHDLIFIDTKKAISTSKIELPAQYILKDFIAIQKDDAITIGNKINVDGIEITSMEAGSVILSF